MGTKDTYLAVFLGSKSSPSMLAWNALADDERRAREREGMAAWTAWAQKNQGAIVEMGGPLGKTREVTANGSAETSNNLAAFTIVRAPSLEAAARLFEQHPHFSIFPGDAVQIMPVLPIPGA